MNKFDIPTTTPVAAPTATAPTANRFDIPNYTNPATLNPATQPKISQAPVSHGNTFGIFTQPFVDFLNNALQKGQDFVKGFIDPTGLDAKQKLQSNPTETESLINTSFNLAVKQKSGQVLTPQEQTLYSQGQKAFLQKNQDLITGFLGGDTEAGQSIVNKLVDSLAIEKDPQVIAEALSKAGLPEHLVGPSAEHIATLDTPAQVRNYLSQLSSASPNLNPFGTGEVSTDTPATTTKPAAEKSIIPTTIDQFNNLTPEMQSNVFDHLSPALKEQIYNMPAGTGNESKTVLDEYANKIINGELKIKTGPEFKTEAYEGLGKSQYMRSFTKSATASPIDEIVQQINDKGGTNISNSDLLDRLQEVADAKAQGIKAGASAIDKAGAGITPDIQEMAAKDWDNNYSENYQKLTTESSQLAKEIKTASEADKPAIQTKIETALKEQQRIEDEFTTKWRAHAGLSESGSPLAQISDTKAPGAGSETNLSPSLRQTSITGLDSSTKTLYTTPSKLYNLVDSSIYTDYSKVNALSQANEKPFISDIEKATGLQPTVRLKSEASFKGKLSRMQAKGIDPKEMTDTVAGRVVVKAADVAKQVENIKKNFNVVNIRDWFKKPSEYGYRGVNISVKLPSGTLAEIQIHTPQSLEVQNATHKFYEKWRNLTTEPTPEQVKEMISDKVTTQAIADNIMNPTPVPAATDTLKSTVAPQTMQTPTENPVPLSKGVETLSQLPEEEKLSLRPIINDVAKTVKDKVHIMDYFQTPEFVLKKLGLSAESDLLHTAYSSYRSNLKTEIAKITDWKNEVANIPGASKNIFRYLDGWKAIKLSTTERLVGNQMREYLAEWADKLNLPKDHRVANYITHLFEPDFLQKEFDPELARIITDKVAGSVYDPFLEQRLGAMGYKEDVFGALDAYVKRAVRKVNMDPALEALKKAANELDVESGKYIARLSARINLRPTEIDNLVDNLFKSVFGYKYGVRPVARASQAVRQMVFRGALGLNFTSALKHLFHGVNTYSQLGEKYTVVGYSQIFSRLATRNLDELFKNGVLDDGFIQDKKIGVYKSILQKLDPILFSFFDTADKINRGAAYYGAKAKAIAAGNTEAEAIDKAVRLVRKTNFSFSNIDSPVILSSDLAKMALQFQTYNVKQIEFLKNMIKDKQFGGMLRWIGASLVFIATIGKAFGMKITDLVPSVDLGGSPTGSFLTGIGDIISGNPQNVAAGKKLIGNTILDFLPAGTQLKKTVEGIGAYNAGKDTTPTGRTRFNIPKSAGSFVQNALFGKSATPEAQKYYDQLNNKGSKKAAPIKTGNRFSK